MSILIVIPCLNEEAMLPGLLDWLSRENPDCPIVVADGRSTDRSREIVRTASLGNPHIHLLDNPDRLQSAGINRAVEQFGDGRDWLVRVDAHCDYPPDYVARLVATARDRGATSVVVPMVSIGQRCFQLAAATSQNSRLGTGGSAHRHVGQGTWVDHGHHALMALDLFRAVGGYRADMSHNEDAELDHRLAKAGGRIWLEPSLALGYHPRSSARALWRQYFAYGKGRARTVLLHRIRPKLRQLLPIAVPLAAIVALVSPFWWPAAVPVALWLSLCLIAGVLIGWRAGGGCRLLAGVAAAIMHLAWGSGFLAQLIGQKRS